MSWRSRFSRSMIEVVFNYSETATSSNALRSYLSKNYQTLQHLNPNFDFLLRPWDGPAQITCIYDYGNEKQVNLDNMPYYGLAEAKVGGRECVISQRVFKCFQPFSYFIILTRLHFWMRIRIQR